MEFLSASVNWKFGSLKNISPTQWSSYWAAEKSNMYAILKEPAGSDYTLPKKEVKSM